MLQICHKVPMNHHKVQIPRKISMVFIYRGSPRPTGLPGIRPTTLVGMTSFPTVARVEDFPYNKSEQNLGIPITIGDAPYENFQSQLQKQETIVYPYYYLGNW